jgi:hypothetical protein
MPRGKTRRAKKSIRTYSRRQRGGYFFLPGSLVKLKPERADEIIGKIKAKCPTCILTPEDVLEVWGYETKTRNCFLTYLIKTVRYNPVRDEKGQTGYCIPIDAVVPVFENNRSDLSDLADNTPISGFFNLSTAQQQLIDPTKQYKIRSDITGIAININTGYPHSVTETYGYTVVLRDAPEDKFGSYTPRIYVLRNQIIVKGDDVNRVFTNANKNKVLNIRRKLFTLPKIEYPLRTLSPGNTAYLPKYNISPYEALLKSEEDELVKFRVFQQHVGNCWSDAFFTILFEASAIRVYCIPFLISILNHQLILFETTIVSLQPQLFDKAFDYFSMRLNWREKVLGDTPAKDIHIKKFLFNSFQRYINKIVQYKSLRNATAAGAGAGLAPTTSLNIPTVEMYQRCYHPGMFHGTTDTGIGGRIERDLLPFLPTFLEILRESNELLRRKNLRSIQVEDIYTHKPANKPGFRVSTVKYIDPKRIEAYYFNIYAKNVSSRNEKHKGHVVALLRKRVEYDPSSTDEELNAKASYWYFYDNDYGIFKCTDEMNILLNEYQVKKTAYTPSKVIGQPGTWTFELWKFMNIAEMRGQDAKLEISFGNYSYEYEGSFEVFAFVSNAPAPGPYIEPDFQHDENL